MGSCRQRSQRHEGQRRSVEEAKETTRLKEEGEYQLQSRLLAMRRYRELTRSCCLLRRQCSLGRCSRRGIGLFIFIVCSSARLFFLKLEKKLRSAVALERCPRIGSISKHTAGRALGRLAHMLGKSREPSQSKAGTVACFCRLPRSKRPDVRSNDSDEAHSTVASVESYYCRQ